MRSEYAKFPRYFQPIIPMKSDAVYLVHRAALEDALAVTRMEERTTHTTPWPLRHTFDLIKFGFLREISRRTARLLLQEARRQGVKQHPRIHLNMPIEFHPRAAQPKRGDFSHA